MQVTCYLRELRGERPLRELEARTGIHRGTLSRIERGLQLPTADQIRAMEPAYGSAVERWYRRESVLVVQESA